MPPKRKKEEDDDDEYSDFGDDNDEDWVLDDAHEGAEEEYIGFVSKHKGSGTVLTGSSKRAAKGGGGQKKRGKGVVSKGKGAGGTLGPNKGGVGGGGFGPGGRLTSSFRDDADEDEMIFQDFSKSLTLKRDHMNRPLWITPEAVIYLEAFSPHYAGAYDFLVAIAEPQARPKYIHTYLLTENSLYAAVALSIDTEKIIKTLNRLCKTDVPSRVIQYIRDCTYTFGKAKLVLKDNTFFVESQRADILRELLKNPTIKEARIMDDVPAAGNTIAGDGSATVAGGEGFVVAAMLQEDRRNLQYAIGLGEEDDDDDEEEEEDYMAVAGSGGGAVSSTKKTVSFKIAQHRVQAVKRSAKEESRYPLMEEYDFKNDKTNPVLQMMDLRPSTKLREHQSKSLNKMFGNGRARSGIIVLPCGAGKSLTGVAAASTIKRNTMILCINNASVKQWRDEFKNWTTVPETSIKMFTSGSKEQLPPPTEACIVITTYHMVCHGKRSASGEIVMNSIKSREWGLMILDEVHVAPADAFQKVLLIVNAHCKLGLTATLVREDEKIGDLNFLVGPKLYEANWIDLTEQGYLARVMCVEVWCPMTKEFYAEYIRGSSRGANNHRVQRLLYTVNPTKMRTCEYLVKKHHARGDKIIIFSDDVPALILYCQGLKGVLDVPYIYGDVPEAERQKIIKAFKSDDNICSCIGLSKVGDTALDIPDANVIIQVSSLLGSRRQEAQRLGRILRPKSGNPGGFNAFFYSLISKDTREMYFSTKRQQYLVDQGYTYSVDQMMSEEADKESTLLNSKENEIRLLNQVVKFNYAMYDEVEDKKLRKMAEGEDDDDDASTAPRSKGASASALATSADAGGSVVRRTVTSLSDRSGAGGMLYEEF